MNHTERIVLARQSLLGVSIGDAFGDSFFGDEDAILERIATRSIPDTRWEFTDDTVMSISVCKELEAQGDINQEQLVKRFIACHDLDPRRGYGATLRRVLREIAEGEDWQTVSARVFEGQGSMGNGAAMRVCPIGAYHYDNLQQVKALAAKSAEVTHCHPEAIAGAIAVAVATAIATGMKLGGKSLSSGEFTDSILTQLPESDTTSRIAKAKTLPYSYHTETLKKVLGNGVNMTAQDTVPFVIWCASHHLNHFEEALWKAVSILGDRDTICAMVGGITMMSAPGNSVPKAWSEAVEDVGNSIFRTNAGNPSL